MRNVVAKVSFELTKDGTITIEIRGSKKAAKSGLLAIIEGMAESDGSTTSELLEELSEISNMKEAHEEIPQGVKDLFDEMFWGLN